MRNTKPREKISKTTFDIVLRITVEDVNRRYESKTRFILKLLSIKSQIVQHLH